MASLGVFDWIRDGVRRSIIMGVSDAFEQLGTPDDRADLHPQLAGALREVAPRMIEDSADTATITPPKSGKAERRRLGRSLEQIRATADKLGKDAA